MHPDMIKGSMENQIDSINGSPVEDPSWCPLKNIITIGDVPVPEQNIPQIENFIKEIRLKFQKYVNILTDGDPNYLLTEESKFEMILEPGKQEAEIIAFAEDMMNGRLDAHFDFILLYSDKKPGTVIFEMLPRHVRASTMMKVCFPENLKLD